MKGKRVCRIHGGLSPGRQGPRDAEHLRKLREGSKRWYAERRARKAAGLPVHRMGRIPGRRPGEPIDISRVRAMVKREMANLPARTDRPFAELEPPEMLEGLTTKALCKMAEVLDLPTDLDSLGGDRMMQHRLYRLQADVAQSITSTRVKVDDAGLRHQQHEDWLEAFNKKLAEAEAKLKTKQERISKE